jgi:hypothetical protein
MGWGSTGTTIVKSMRIMEEDEAHRSQNFFPFADAAFNKRDTHKTHKTLNLASVTSTLTTGGDTTGSRI